jgi:hypothetical protein
MESLAAPLLTQLSVVLEPGLMLAGLAPKELMVGADPLVGGGLVGSVVLFVTGSFDDPPQLESNAHTISKSAGAPEPLQVRVRWMCPAERVSPRLSRDVLIAMALMVSAGAMRGRASSRNRSTRREICANFRPCRRHFQTEIVTTAAPNAQARLHHRKIFQWRRVRADHPAARKDQHGEGALTAVGGRSHPS